MTSQFLSQATTRLQYSTKIVQNSVCRNFLNNLVVCFLFTKIIEENKLHCCILISHLTKGSFRFSNSNVIRFSKLVLCPDKQSEFVSMVLYQCVATEVLNYYREYHLRNTADSDKN